MNPRQLRIQLEHPHPAAPRRAWSWPFVAACIVVGVVIGLAFGLNAEQAYDQTHGSSYGQQP